VSSKDPPANFANAIGGFGDVVDCNRFNGPDAN
jgi:hypothetical protein